MPLRLAATALLLTGCASNTASSPTSRRNVTGVWQGTMSYLDESAPIGFMIADDGGLLSGEQIVYDPVSRAEIATDPISGASEGGAARWKTLGGGFVITGSFAGKGLGAALFPDEGFMT
ncbi:MAG: hypothetical protein ACYDDA_16360 [Acidiferrobacteraceae bacterium]